MHILIYKEIGVSNQVNAEVGNTRKGLTVVKLTCIRS